MGVEVFLCAQGQGLMVRLGAESAPMGRTFLKSELADGSWLRFRQLPQALRIFCFVAIVGLVYELSINLSLLHVKSLLQSQQTEAARAWLSYVRAYSVDRVETRILLARVAWRAGLIEEVRQHLVAAKRLGCPDERIEFEQTLILAYEGRLIEMERALQRLLLTNDDDLQHVCDAFVTGYLRQFRFEEARRLLDVWRQDFPNDSQPWFHDGRICQFEMRPIEASVAFEKALENGQHRVDIRERLAVVRVQNLEFAEAARHYDLLLRIQPDHVEWLVGFGVCLFNDGNARQAREAFLKALTISPAHRDGRLAFAELEANDGHYEEALRLSRDLCHEFPNDYSVRYLMARMLRTLDHQEESLKHVQWLEEAERALREVSDLTDKVNRRPDDVQSRVEIAKRLNRYSKYSEAVGWLRAAQHLEPNNEEILRLLAESCRLAGFDDLASLHSLR